MTDRTNFIDGAIGCMEELELFYAVPDHPGLTDRQTANLHKRIQTVLKKLDTINDLISASNRRAN